LPSSKPAAILWQEAEQLLASKPQGYTPVGDRERRKHPAVPIPTCSGRGEAEEQNVISRGGIRAGQGRQWCLTEGAQGNFVTTSAQACYSTKQPECPMLLLSQRFSPNIKQAVHPYKNTTETLF